MLSSAPQRSSALAVRVVSYNVLSSQLARPSQYPKLDPADLDPSARLPVVLEKVKEELEEHDNVILCLQEVSYDWAGPFHTLFANKGYHFVTGLYGRKFNGYMGVGIAWPTASFETVDVDMCRLSDKREGGWPVAPEEALTTKLWSSMQAIWGMPWKTLGLFPPSKPERDHWEISEYRFNMLLTCTLKDRSSDQQFCIGNYHMPCAFYAPKVMTIHSDMVSRRVQMIAATKGNLPYIVAGDWNIKPTDTMYGLLTKGELDKEDESYPTPKHGMEWETSITPMRSAYAEAGGEPDFTNFASQADVDEPFVDTLDYIFISEEWTVRGAKTLPHRSEAGGPFPNLKLKEPSDHILIAADLELPATK